MRTPFPIYEWNNRHTPYLFPYVYSCFFFFLTCKQTLAPEGVQSLNNAEHSQEFDAEFPEDP